MAQNTFASDLWAKFGIPAPTRTDDLVKFLLRHADSLPLRRWVDERRALEAARSNLDSNESCHSEHQDVPIGHDGHAVRDIPVVRDFPFVVCTVSNNNVIRKADILQGKKSVSVAGGSNTAVVSATPDSPNDFADVISRDSVAPLSNPSAETVRTTGSVETSSRRNPSTGQGNRDQRPSLLGPAAPSSDRLTCKRPRSPSLEARKSRRRISTSSSSSSSSSSSPSSSSMTSSPSSDSDGPYHKLARTTIRRKAPSPEPSSAFAATVGNEAYEEYLRTEPIPPRPETESSLFVSKDPRENRDNSPTRWSSMRELKDDDERKQFAARQVKFLIRQDSSGFLLKPSPL